MSEIQFLLSMHNKFIFSDKWKKYVVYFINKLYQLKNNK